MFKDYDKYLSASLKVYLFLLFIICILKLVGFDYFGLDLTNPTMLKINNLISNNHIGYIYNFVSLYIQLYFYLCLCSEKRKIYKETFVATTFLFVPQCILFTFFRLNWIYPIWSIVIYFMSPIFITKKFQTKKQIKYIIAINLYQLISLFIRNVGINNNYGNFLIDSILNIDQLLLLAITYNLHFMKGDENLCGVVQVLHSSLLKKRHFSTLQRNLQKNYSSFKKLNKQEKATIIIYSTLSLIWNIFTLVVVLLIGKLNDTFIECLFIITSFWLSKKVFGKPFHLKSMLQCFILSNTTYYILNRITTPMGISILVPIMLGVGLSYLTSKLVKNTYKPLYKGMPKEDFENTILKVVDKGSNKYNICYDYFIEKENAIFLARRYNYTEAGIRKITSRVNDDIKALNK